MSRTRSSSTARAAAWPYPKMIAHRGAGKLAPENTLAAVRLGAAHGYRMFEFDVQLSGDAVPMLLHDPTLDRTTDGSGIAGTRAYAEIARLDAGSWHSAEYAGEPVPTLRNVARYLLARGLAANIEIKPGPGRDAETGAVVAAEAAWLWQRAPAPPLLSSFSEAALEAALRTLPQLPRALLCDAVPNDWQARLERLQCVAIDVRHDALSAELVDQVHRAGYRVLTYTVNEPERVRLLRDWGVDAVITDAVDRVRAE
ncbi:MAG TPA: glycerophosphodiester phosphodiesterase [Burkholderiaceae bacterium]|nr:glycerophosphodiester phosphodiesterase [Burkholderiaceae bacterium]